MEKLQQWMPACSSWHLAVDRYKEFELRNTRKPKRLSGSPTGLGTSAARIASLLGGARPGVGCQ